MSPDHEPVEFEVRLTRQFQRRLRRRDLRGARRLFLVVGALLMAGGLAGMQADSFWALIGAVVFFIGFATWLAVLRMLISPMRGRSPVFGPVRYRIGSDGVEWTLANGTYTRRPWSAVNRVEELKDRFVVIDETGQAARIIPRDVLDPAVQQRIRTVVAAALGNADARRQLSRVGE